MHSRKVKVVVATVLTAVTVFLFILFHIFSCVSSGRLPSGYSIWTTNSYTTCLFGPVRIGTLLQNDCVIGAKITRMQVVGTLIIGYIESSPMSELSDIERPGFFVVDSAAHIVLLSCGTREEMRALVLIRYPGSALRLRSICAWA